MARGEKRGWVVATTLVTLFAFTSCALEPEEEVPEIGYVDATVEDGPTPPSWYRSNAQVYEGLVAAETCLAITWLLVLLVKVGIVSGVGKALPVIWDWQVKAIIGLGAYVGVTISTAEATALLTGTGSVGGILLGKATGFYFNACGRGAQEVWYAIRDLGPVVKVLWDGSSVGLLEARSSDSPGVAAGRVCANEASFWSFSSRHTQCITCCGNSSPPPGAISYSFPEACQAVCNAVYK
jgi:hypothetical protein